MTLDGRMLIDVHLHAARLPTLKPAWHEWSDRYGDAALTAELYDTAGTIRPPEIGRAHV